MNTDNRELTKLQKDYLVIQFGEEVLDISDTVLKMLFYSDKGNTSNSFPRFKDYLKQHLLELRGKAVVLQNIPNQGSLTAKQVAIPLTELDAMIEGLE